MRIKIGLQTVCKTAVKTNLLYLTDPLVQQQI